MRCGWKLKTEIARHKKNYNAGRRGGKERTIIEQVILRLKGVSGSLPSSRAKMSAKGVQM